MASVFSGKAGRNAGIWAADAAGKFYDVQAAELGKARADALSALRDGRTSGLSALDDGYGKARPEYEGAISRLDPWVKQGTAANTKYGDSVGLGGQAGFDNAVATYRATPGYERRVNEATDAVARKASATGVLGSGNTLAAIADRVQGIADQDYSNWQDRLKGLSDQGFQGAGMQAGIQKGLGDLETQNGRDKAGIYTGMAGQEAGTFTNFANLANSNIANLANTVIGAGTGAMQAGQQAAQNRLNFGMNLFNTAANLGGRLFAGKFA